MLNRHPGLDLLRAIAISWVLLFHGITEGLGAALPGVARLGWMGVDLFFVLSGFLIGSQLLKDYAAGRTPALGAFYLRRAFRILPVFWVITALYFLSPALRESRGIQPCWQFLTFTENFLIDVGRNRTFSHAWSLCVEEHFYLLFPLLVWALMRRPSWKMTTVVCVVLVGGGMLLRAYLWLNHVATNPGGAPFVELIYYPTHTRLDGLRAGVVLAALRWFRPRLWQKAMEHAYPLLGAGLVSLAVAINTAQGRTDFNASVFGFPLLSLSFALIVAACASPMGVLGRVRIPGAGALATVTFSLYLSHKMTWHAVRTWWPGLVQHGGAQAFCVYAGAALLVGSLLYLGIERPFLRLRQSCVAGVS